MQGELSEIDVRSILQLVELGQRTGQLLVEPYGGRGMYVFFINGKIIYAGNPDVGLHRLQGFLTRYRLESTIAELGLTPDLTTSAPEYALLWHLLENRTLSPADARDILQSMVHETLFDLLSLHQGHFIFELGAPLSPQLATFDIMPVVTQVMQQVQEWKQWHPHIQSPDQVPTIVDGAALEEALPISTVKTLLSYIDGQTNLRQIARLLSRDISAVTRALYPCIQRGWIQVSEPELPASSTTGRRRAWSRSIGEDRPTPCVVCLDDASTVRHTVDALLKRNGYQSISFEHPIAALSQFFEVKPDLILCDITMPNLDGYEVCAMLRQSTQFRQTPIIMLTGRDGFIDRVRAQMVGATDYLAKPFGEEELITLVEQYIGPGATIDPSLDLLLQA